MDIYFRANSINNNNDNGWVCALMCVDVVVLAFTKENQISVLT